MKLLDYLFYRTHSFYKRKKDSTPILMGCLIPSLLVCLTILSTIVLLSVFLKLHFDDNLKPLMLLLLIVVPLLFWRRYGKVEYAKELEERYKDEESGSKRLHGWLFILYLIFVLLVPISVGYMRHNLGMNI